MTKSLAGATLLIALFAIAFGLAGCEYTETVTDPNGESYQVPVTVTLG